MSDRALEDGEFKRGPGGRPTREEAERRHRSLFETAFRLFLEKGWEGASIDEISRRSGVAKGFIYARYPDKAALFVGAIERLMEDAMGPCRSATAAGRRRGRAVAFGRRLLDLALRPEALALHRLFIAEATEVSGARQALPRPQSACST